MYQLLSIRQNKSEIICFISENYNLLKLIFILSICNYQNYVIYMNIILSVNNKNYIHLFILKFEQNVNLKSKLVWKISFHFDPTARRFPDFGLYMDETC